MPSSGEVADGTQLSSSLADDVGEATISKVPGELERT